MSGCWSSKNSPLIQLINKDRTLGLIGVSMLDPLELYPFKLFALRTFLEALKESVSNKRK